MQTLKEELRSRLIEEATREFIANGYEKASLRKIAKAAGTTIGNVYRYFPNKEELFYSITTPVYESFAHFLQHHDSETVPEHTDTAFRQAIGQVLTAHEAAFTDGFLLLLEGSQGTKYEGVREEFQTLVAQHATEHIEQAGKQAVFHPQFPRIVAAGFLAGLVTILKQSRSAAETQQLLGEYILFYSRGMAGALG